jgi:hypothetical protein
MRYLSTVIADHYAVRYRSKYQEMVERCTRVSRGYAPAGKKSRQLLGDGALVSGAKVGRSNRPGRTFFFNTKPSPQYFHSNSLSTLIDGNFVIHVPADLLKAEGKTGYTAKLGLREPLPRHSDAAGAIRCAV